MFRPKNGLIVMLLHHITSYVIMIVIMLGRGFNRALIVLWKHLFICYKGVDVRCMGHILLVLCCLHCFHYFLIIVMCTSPTPKWIKGVVQSLLNQWFM